MAASTAKSESTVLTVADRSPFEMILRLFSGNRHKEQPRALPGAPDPEPIAAAQPQPPGAQPQARPLGTAGATRHANVPTSPRLERLSQPLPAVVTKESSIIHARDFSEALYDVVRRLVTDAAPGDSIAAIKFTEPKDVPEPEQAWHMRDLSRDTIPLSYFRWRANLPNFSLSVRASRSLVEVFVIPAEETPLLSFSEFGSRLKARIELVRTADGHVWFIGKTQAHPDEVIALARRCLDRLVRAETQQTKVAPKEPESLRNDAPSLEQLLFEKQNLVYKLVSQQEQMKSDVARELHDSVIADLMMLKRYISGDKTLSKEETLEIIDEIVQQLRDICNDFSPRHLQDWGLETSIRGLVERVEERSGLGCELHCHCEVPVLPDLVQLHTYRIMQECLNNVEKYSMASSVAVKIELEDRVLSFTVEDDGQGFDLESKSAGDKHPEGGGMGMESMRQRADLIRAYYPTKLSVNSAIGKGSTVRLEIVLGPGRESLLLK